MRNKHSSFVIAPFQVLSLIIDKLKFCCLNNSQDKFSKENNSISDWESISVYKNHSVCFSYTSKSSNIWLIKWFFKILVSNTRLCLVLSFFFSLFKGMGWDKQSNGTSYLHRTHIKLHGFYVFPWWAPMRLRNSQWLKTQVFANGAGRIWPKIPQQLDLDQEQRTWRPQVEGWNAGQGWSSFSLFCPREKKQQMVSTTQVNPLGQMPNTELWHVGSLVSEMGLSGSPRVCIVKLVGCFPASMCFSAGDPTLGKKRNCNKGMETFVKTSFGKWCFRECGGLASSSLPAGAMCCSSTISDHSSCFFSFCSHRRVCVSTWHRAEPLAHRRCYIYNLAALKITLTSRENMLCVL